MNWWDMWDFFTKLDDSSIAYYLEEEDSCNGATVIKRLGKCIIDAHGEKWTINHIGQITKSGEVVWSFIGGLLMLWKQDVYLLTLVWKKWSKNEWEYVTDKTLTRDLSKVLEQLSSVTGSRIILFNWLMLNKVNYWCNLTFHTHHNTCRSILMRLMHWKLWKYCIIKSLHGK